MVGRKRHKVGIAGLGTIGSRVAQELDNGLAGLELVAVTTPAGEKVRARLADYAAPIQLVSAPELAVLSDIIVDSAPSCAFREILVPALKEGCTVVSVNGAAILNNPDIVELASEYASRIILASGGTAALDAVRAAAEGTIHSVKMEMRKPPRTLATDPYILENDIDLDALHEPLRVFAGSVREASRQFPTKVNIAAAFALAGIGADRTQLEVWADPLVVSNSHCVTVDSDSARFNLSLENYPSEGRSATGKLSALSVITALRGIVDTPLKVGM